MAGSLTKKCSKCSETKVLALFNKHPHTTNRRRPECAECTKKYHRAHRSGKPPEWNRKYALKKFFGLTLDQYAAMLIEQHGRCAICGTTKSSNVTKHLCVDHDHGTGKVRGLLCHGCNRGLGFLKDDVELLAAAIKYLSSHEEGK